MEEKTVKKVYRSHGMWSNQDSYILCMLHAQGNSQERISQLMVGRTKQAIQQRLSKLRKSNKLNHRYWEARIKEDGLELPEIPTFQARVGVAKPEPNGKPASIEIMVDDMIQVLGPGSLVTLRSRDGLVVEVKVKEEGN